MEGTGWLTHGRTGGSATGPYEADQTDNAPDTASGTLHPVIEDPAITHNDAVYVQR